MKGLDFCKANGWVLYSRGSRLRYLPNGAWSWHSNGKWSPAPDNAPEYDVIFNTDVEFRVVPFKLGGFCVRFYHFKTSIWRSNTAIPFPNEQEATHASIILQLARANNP